MKTLKTQPELIEIEFQGQRIEVLWDGTDAWVVVKRICENLGIQPHHQRKKIQENEVFEGRWSVTGVPSSGGKQETLCLHFDALAYWLSGISHKRIPNPEKRARVIAYKRDCMKTLAQRLRELLQQPQSSTLPEPLPAQSTSLSLSGVPATDILAPVLQELAEVRRRLNELESSLRMHLHRDITGLREHLHGQEESADRRLKDQRTFAFERYQEAIRHFLPEAMANFLNKRESNERAAALQEENKKLQWELEDLRREHRDLREGHKDLRQEHKDLLSQLRKLLGALLAESPALLATALESTIIWAEKRGLPVERIGAVGLVSRKKSEYWIPPEKLEAREEWAEWFLSSGAWKQRFSAEDS